MSRQRLRIFVSSPGDVTAAREIAAQIIEKVAHEFVRFFAIEPYLWEYEPMLASGHFQDSIDPPSKFDAVILILGSRLGTALPERTAVREYRGIDGRTPVTGTEWEFEDALAGARERGVPDLLVYRSRRHAEVSTWDAQSRQAVLRQIEALDSFWSRHFADQGSFIGGYAEFVTLEEFADQLENGLRGCVQRRLQALEPAERAQTARLWTGSPFRGLEAYEFKHAPIFFGREEAIGTALLRLITNAQAGRPFLLVLGASGSGKSSLVKAGILPRLLVPQRVSGIAFLRRVVFRPGDARADEDLFDAFARCLITGDGDSTGLPEIVGGSMDGKDLARHLRESSTHPDMPFAMVLDRLAASARAQGRMLRYEQARLILEVDQLEEVFTSERVQPAQRARFVQLLEALVRSGLVWVIATMRADFWHRASETPELVRLADSDGRLDLLLPRPSQLSQMIRGPAEAAAIHFEVHPSTGIPLNDLIGQEAAGDPGALPLLSYLLDQLYRRDIEERGDDTLTYASYNALGGLKGAIATRADAVIAAQPAEVQQALRPALFALVQMSAGEGSMERAVARRAPMSEFPEGTPKRRLLESLLDPSARLLVADAAGASAATVRVAHEALISEWKLARDYVAKNSEALRIRRTVEERYARWRELNKENDAPARLSPRVRTSVVRLFGAEHGLLADVDLTDGRRLLRDYPEELSPEVVAYIGRSRDQDRRRRRRAVRIAAGVAVLTSMLAVGAAYESHLESLQRIAAREAQLRSLTQTAAARLRDNDVAGAMATILEVLPPHRTGPYEADALNVFHQAQAADSQLLVITGHTDIVGDAVFSPDGRRVLTSSYDKTARIWDGITGRQLLSVSGHAQRLRSTTFSPDGRRIAAASMDGTARIWDAVTGQQLLVLNGHTKAAQTVAFSPDGRRVVTASEDRTARLWDATTGEQRMVFIGHQDGLLDARFSPDGRQIVTSSRDDTARIWDVETGRQLRSLIGHSDRVNSADFSPDGRRIVTSSYDDTARIWDARSAQQMLVLSINTGIERATFSPDGDYVVTASFDAVARIWDAVNGRQLRVLSGHTKNVESAVFSPDGRKVVTASNDGTARIWAITSARLRLLMRGHTDRVNGAVFSPDGQRVATASDDNTVRIWDARSGRELMVLKGHADRVLCVAFSPDGRRIVTGSNDRTARIWDARSGVQLLVLNGHTNRVASAAFSADGRFIVTGSYDKTARIWDAANGRPLLVLSGHSDRVSGAAFSPDGRLVATGSYDKTASIWDRSTGHQMLVLRGHTDHLTGVAFSPDGRQVVTISEDTTARIWDTASGEQLRILSGHTDTIEGVAFSPDGQRVATSADDKTARIWDAMSGEQLLVIAGHTDSVETASFSPDGRDLLTASDDRTVAIWDARVPPLSIQIEWARAAQFDPLSHSERFQLGLPLEPGVRQWPAGASKCDQAAAAPYDPARRAAGIVVDQIVTDVALQACALEEASASGDDRSLYQHGRALVAKADLLAARGDFERAIGGGYSAAGVDLAILLSQPSAGMLDVFRAISLEEGAWANGVTVAAFELGTLYEHGVRKTGVPEEYALRPDEARAWSWYEKGAGAGEPNALARFGNREDRAALTARSRAERNAFLLKAFTYYASAAERARLEDWPDSTWRDWRYRRASIARLLAGEGMMQEVAREYDEVRKRYAPRPALWQQVASHIGVN